MQAYIAQRLAIPTDVSTGASLGKFGKGLGRHHPQRVPPPGIELVSAELSKSDGGQAPALVCNTCTRSRFRVMLD
jgi:hypothetical protein